ncbi:FmdE family protein [Desulfomonile tiedjei]|uniref:FmdE, Molybdenum formylmethanofuran dehydrogenase operon n=1 Tax=Desulfomonile tiedjei (strain ATCC 49306 / DSM 6799 / DCB-1) TaxID=706587 RepID=I4C446_DESTA|nr:FmdE, Molybdenum formylmethanofuran dehydrogenase operon [Desulfomonile tiedjei DSM 6799]
MTDGQLPQDFLKCVDFHGHVCPGLAIGYAAVRRVGLLSRHDSYCFIEEKVSSYESSRSFLCIFMGQSPRE